MQYRIDEAVHQLQRYGSEPKEVVVELLELLTDLNDDMQHMRDLGSIKQRIIIKLAECHN